MFPKISSHSQSVTAAYGESKTADYLSIGKKGEPSQVIKLHEMKKILDRMGDGEGQWQILRTSLVYTRSDNRCWFFFIIVFKISDAHIERRFWSSLAEFFLKCVHPFFKW